MNLIQDLSPAAGDYELLFASLFVQGRGYAFPCDSQGRVNLDALTDTLRNNYLYARAVVGREFAMPAVHARGPAGHLACA